MAYRSSSDEQEEFERGIAAQREADERAAVERRAAEDAEERRRQGAGDTSGGNTEAAGVGKTPNPITTPGAYERERYPGAGEPPPAESLKEPFKPAPSGAGAVIETSNPDKYTVRLQIPGRPPGEYTQRQLTRAEVERLGLKVPERGQGYYTPEKEAKEKAAAEKKSKAEYDAKFYPGGIPKTITIGADTDNPIEIKNTKDLIRLKEDKPTLYNTLVKGGESAYRSAVDSLNAAERRKYNAAKFIEQQESKRFETLNEKLPDGQYVPKTFLDDIEKTDPTLHQLLTTRGVSGAQPYINVLERQYEQSRRTQQKRDLAISILTHAGVVDGEGGVDGAAYLREYKDEPTLRNAGFSGEDIKTWRDYNKGYERTNEPLPELNLRSGLKGVGDYYEYQAKLDQNLVNNAVSPVVLPLIDAVGQAFENVGTATFAIGTGRAFEIEAKANALLAQYMAKQISYEAYKKEADKLATSSQNIIDDYKALPEGQKLLWELPLYYDLPLSLAKQAYKLLTAKALRAALREAVLHGGSVSKLAIDSDAERVFLNQALKDVEAYKLSKVPGKATYVITDDAVNGAFKQAENLIREAKAGTGSKSTVEAFQKLESTLRQPGAEAYIPDSVKQIRGIVNELQKPKTLTELAREQKVSTARITTQGPADVGMSGDQFARFLKSRSTNPNITPEAFKFTEELSRGLNLSPAAKEKLAQALNTGKVTKAKEYADFIAGTEKGDIYNYQQLVEDYQAAIKKLGNTEGLRPASTTEAYRLGIPGRLTGEQLNVMLKRWQDMGKGAVTEILGNADLLTYALATKPQDTLALTNKLSTSQQTDLLDKVKEYLKQQQQTGVINKDQTGALEESYTQLLTGTETKVQTSTATAPKQSEKTETKTETITGAKPGTETPAPTTTAPITTIPPAQVIPPPPPPQPGKKPKPIRLPASGQPSDADARRAIKAADGAIAWRMGKIGKKDRWDVIVNPYESNENYLMVLGKAPEGASIAQGGPKSAYRTAQVLRGQVPKRKVNVDSGFQDITITPKGRRVSLHFKPDPQGLTKGDITIGERKSNNISERRPRISRRIPRITPKRPKIR